MAAATREPLVHPGAPVADMLASSLRLSAGHNDEASNGQSRFDRACDCLRRMCGLGSRRHSRTCRPCRT
ncbi:unnamed protein product [Prorocentrum cordatum]|uniref:Uncharacterized protein n=1 Tax=Prorocentrum cordatum TaxID=2364126 RepID=A0ABN9RRB2_9DINO|nr:unnamed protein product [Polarella glacialis]